MERLGETLQYYIMKRNRGFSITTVCQIGHRLLNILEKVHQAGLVYNDLKLDNIMVGDGNKTPESLSQIRLIDFGLCSEYLDANGEHIEFGLRADFIGNLALSSKNAMNFTTQSRRDDLISLNYILIYLFQGDFEILTDLGTGDFFEQVKKRKNEATPESLCG